MYKGGNWCALQADFIHSLLVWFVKNGLNLPSRFILSHGFPSLFPNQTGVLIHFIHFSGSSLDEICMWSAFFTFGCEHFNQNIMMFPSCIV